MRFVFFSLLWNLSPVFFNGFLAVYSGTQRLLTTRFTMSTLQTLYDKDTFTVDDHMGDAEIDIQPYLEAMKLVSQGSQSGAKVGRIDPSWENCLADESCIIWKDGKLTQEMILRLRHVECGEVEIQIEVIDAPSPKGKGILF